jgi:hypothetical protein
MRFNLAYGLLLAVAALVSERSARTVLSTAVLFLIAGFVLGRGGLGLLSLQTTDRAIEHLAELALFTLLFAEGFATPALPWLLRHTSCEWFDRKRFDSDRGSKRPLCWLRTGVPGLRHSSFSLRE